MKHCSISPRTVALFLSLVLVAGFFQGFVALVTPERALATYATGGTGLHRGSIDWFEWGTAGQAIPSGGLTKTNSRTIAGRTVVTTCTISSINGSLQAYRPGTWTGDGLDDLYNVGGTGDKNGIVTGLSNTTPAALVSFNFSCAVTLDGVAVPLQGLVVADAEQSDTDKEYIEATPDQPGVIWRIIDRYRSPGCRNETTANLTANKLRLWGPDILNRNACEAGPMAVGFMDGATSARVALKGAGKSAIALGVMLSSSDFGDAPASYGEAGALLATSWDGGTLSASNTKVSADTFALATQSQSTPRLGTIVDGEPTQLHTADATGDDTFGAPADNPVNDEDGVGPLGTIDVVRGGIYTKSVACAGPGSVAGWIDWNSSGTFDPAERSGTVSCTGGSANPAWNVPADTVSSLGDNLTFMRLRIARTVDQVTLPTGTSTSGEVEDHRLNIALPKLVITKTSNATVDSRPGDTITWTLRATNTGKGAFTTAYPATLLDDLTGVLDDATYLNDAVATASPSGTVAYTSPRLSWTGALAVGASVTLTYRTTLKAGGDGTARNVTWEPRISTSLQTPACNVPVGGVDAATGVPCAEARALLPKLSVTKTANRTELPQNGTKVTYTVTVTNSGPGTYTASKPATASDDLTQVLDAATFDNNASATVGTVAYAAPKLSWSGALATGQSARITYSVTYTAGGDQSLVNGVCVPMSERLPGGTGGCASVTVLGANLATSKTVATPDVPAKAGSVLTYTLRFQNTGKSPATVDHDDVLTGVIDDATVAASSASAGLTATRVGDRIRITGSVPVNSIRTVTYTATVKPDGTRGTNKADNFLVLVGQRPPSACVAGDPNCTSTPLPNVRAVKSVNPATGNAVISGQKPTYTLNFTNNGNTTGEVDYTDDLADVLDDATLGAVTVLPAGALTVFTSPNGTLRIRGSLTPTQTAEVSYTVTVKPDAERRGFTAAAGLRKDLLANKLAPTGAANPTCEVGLVVCTHNPVSSWTLVKTAAPASGAYVSPEDVVTYTVTATSVRGDIPGAVVTDDLSDVLNSATFVPGSAQVLIDGVATPLADPTGTILTAGPGTIPAGKSVVLTYRVTVGANAWSQTLRNGIVGTAGAPGAPFPPGFCFDGDENEICSTNHPVTSHVFVTKWGVNGDGIKGPIDGSAFDVRIDVQGAPGTVSGTVAAVAGETGRFEAAAFTPGNYWLVETKAPAGHTLLAKPVAFTIATDGALKLAGGSPQVTLDPADPLRRTIKVADVAAIPLPMTGGGSVNFVVLMMVVLGIGAFGATLIRRQRPERSPIPG